MQTIKHTSLLPGPWMTPQHSSSWPGLVLSACTSRWPHCPAHSKLFHRGYQESSTGFCSLGLSRKGVREHPPFSPSRPPPQPAELFLVPAPRPNSPIKVDSEECTLEFGEKIEEIHKWLVLSLQFSQPICMGKESRSPNYIFLRTETRALCSLQGSENKAARTFLS